MITPSPSMCFIIQDVEEKETSSGIIISAEEKRKTGQGVIYAINAEVVCPHCTQKFDRKDLEVGDRVLFSRYVSEQIDFNEGELEGRAVWVCSLDSILGKIV